MSVARRADAGARRDRGDADAGAGPLADFGQMWLDELDLRIGAPIPFEQLEALRIAAG